MNSLTHGRLGPNVGVLVRHFEKAMQAGHEPVSGRQRPSVRVTPRSTQALRMWLPQERSHWSGAQSFSTATNDSLQATSARLAAAADAAAVARGQALVDARKAIPQDLRVTSGNVTVVPATGPARQEHVEAPAKVRPIAVFAGTGGIASSMALSVLLKDPDAKITLFTRGHAQALANLNEKGLRIEFMHNNESHVVFLSPRVFPNIEWKNYDAARDLAPDTIVIDGNSAKNAPANVVTNLSARSVGSWSVVTVANGLGVREEIERLLSERGRSTSEVDLSPSLAWFNSKNHPEGKGGKFHSTGGRDQLIESRDDASVARELALRAGAIQTPSGPLELIRHQVVPAAEGAAATYMKVGANASLNSLGIIWERKLRAMLGTPGVKDLMKKICEEVFEVARKEGVDLGSAQQVFDSAVELAVIATKNSDFFSSSQSPYQNGEAIELEFVMGRIAEYAKKHGIPAPLNDLINKAVIELARERQAPRLGDDGQPLMSNGKRVPKYASHAEFLADPKVHAMRVYIQEEIKRTANIPHLETEARRDVAKAASAVFLAGLVLGLASVEDESSETR